MSSQRKTYNTKQQPKERYEQEQEEEEYENQEYYQQTDPEASQCNLISKLS